MNSGLYLRSVSLLLRAEDSMREIGVCREGMDIMLPKMRHLVFMVRGMDPRAANILKQEMLAVGAEAAISYRAISDLSTPTDCMLSGTERQFGLAIGKLAMQPFGLKQLSEALDKAVRCLLSPAPGMFGPLKYGQGTLVMGILNLDPDSFSGDGITNTQAAIFRALEMASRGADVIDVGGVSTRPGAPEPGTGVEHGRVIPVLEGLRGKISVPISVDSRDPAVIRDAVKAGASIINLVGGIRSAETAGLLADADTAVILMHMQGEPGNMQQDPRYSDVMDDIVSELRSQISMALDAGMRQENIAVDPGIGFGKSLNHNLEILRRLGEMRILGCPVVVGLSRKSFIGKLLDADVSERLEGSLAGAALASALGADIVRAHDALATVKAVKFADSVLRRKVLSNP